MNQSYALQVNPTGESMHGTPEFQITLNSSLELCDLSGVIEDYCSSGAGRFPDDDGFPQPPLNGEQKLRRGTGGRNGPPNGLPYSLQWKLYNKR